MRRVFVLFLLLLATVCLGETKITKATIAEVSERGFMLKVGTEMIPTEDDSSTRFWKDRQPAKRETFQAGAEVTVRLKVDGAPTIVREMADAKTYDWLDTIRKDVVSGVVAKVDLKYIEMRLDDGSNFEYRYSDKSKFSVKNNTISPSELKEGQHLFIKGRLLPSLDTWIVSASDERAAIAEKATKSSKGAKKPKALQVKKSGTLKGYVELHQPLYHMVDFSVLDRHLHAVYTQKTLIKLDGVKVTPVAIERGLRIEVTYTQDIYGRLIASRIELFHSSTALMTNGFEPKRLAYRRSI